MNSKIIMGNDEFILYVRKQNKKCALATDLLGKRIGEWITNNANGKEIEKNKNCLWGKDAQNVSADGLPYTATQFTFDRNKLPELFDFLDTIE